MLNRPRASVRRVLATLALTLPIAAAGLMIGGAPAQAAACSGATGVIAVVDFGELGGGVVAGCAPSGSGQTSAHVFAEAGISLDWVTSQPGMVCRVGGKPADRACDSSPPTDAYWSLWTAPSTGGPWTYAQRGAGSLRAPENGYIAWSWHQGAGRAAAPAAAATARKPVATPTPSPTRQTTSRPPRPHAEGKGAGTGTATSGAPKDRAPVTSAPAAAAPSEPASTPATASPSTSPSGSVTPTPSASTSTSTTPSPSTSPSASTTPSDAGLPDAASITAGPEDVKATSAGDSGLPVWVPVAVVIALVGAAGAVAVRRRAH